MKKEDYQKNQSGNKAWHSTETSVIKTTVEMLRATLYGSKETNSYYTIRFKQSL